MTVFNDPHRFRVLAAGRRFGKTYLTVAEGVCAALDPRNHLRQPVFLIAPTQAQAKLLYWRQLNDALHRLIVSQNVNEGLLTLANGVLVGVKGADKPESLRGPGLFFAGLDEYGDMKPYVWEEIIRPTLIDSKGRALFIGTPPPERNQFYDLYMTAASGDDPEWAAFSFESGANPFLPEGELEAARRSMSSVAYAREIKASFDIRAGGRIKAEWIKTGEEPKNAVTVVAVDPAGFSDIEHARTARQKQLDEHVIVTAKITTDKEGTQRWFIKDIQHGRWGIKEAANRIVDTLDKEKPLAWGLERGALYNAILPQIQDAARAKKVHIPTPEPLSHENRIKEERILWALEARLEHGLITFRAGAPWLRDVEDQLVHFPSKMVHDDIPDALSYIAQLVEGRIFADFGDAADEPYWTPQDPDIGF
jgi:predicted phage terminase large subunit-like protein